MADRTKKGLSGEALRAFRHSVAGLKKKGLVSPRVDAHSQKPTRYMQAKVRSLAGVFSGEQAAVKVKPAIARQYKEAGFRVINQRVVLPKDLSEVAGVRRGLAAFSAPLAPGIVQQRVVLPFGPRNIDDFLDKVRTDPASINRLKADGEYFAFTFFGRMSLATFEDIELLAEYLEHYNALDGDDAEEAWKELVLYRTYPEAWENLTRFQPALPKRQRRRATQDRRELSRRTPKWAALEADAERKRLKRASLDYLEKERLRDRARKAAVRANNPAYRDKERAKDKAAKAALRTAYRAAKADRDNGWS